MNKLQLWFLAGILILVLISAFLAHWLVFGQWWI